MSQTVREIATRVLKYQEQIGDIEALAAHVLASTEPLGDGIRAVIANATESYFRGHLVPASEMADLRDQLQAAVQEAHKTFARHQEVVDNMLAGLAAYEEQVLSLEQLADERGREAERLRADFEKLGDWISPDIEAKRECTMSAGALNQMRKIYRSMREVLATPAATPPAHVYTSTACQHGLHDRCRKACKFCGVPCLCPCGHVDTSAEFRITPEEAIEYATDEEIGEIPRPDLTLPADTRSSVEKTIGWLGPDGHVNEEWRKRAEEIKTREHPDTAIEWRISYEYCQGGLLGTQHEEWDAFSATVANKEICAEFVAEITDKMHRNIRIESRGPWVDADRTAPEAQR